LIGLILGLLTSYSYGQLSGQRGEVGKGMKGGQKEHLYRSGTGKNVHAHAHLIYVFIFKFPIRSGDLLVG
jgi:hypothetical protein